jgi:ADP-ribose pyrophosphatase YjhB (NUDIX family)
MGCLALPGGFAEPGETIQTSAARELQEETHLTDQELTLTGVYSKPGRDPRGWTVSAAFATLVDGDVLRPSAGDDAASVQWVPIVRGQDGNYGPETEDKVAFDHLDIIKDAAQMLLG